MTGAALVWLRDDLRLADNPALTAAVRTGRPVVVLHIEATDAALRPRGAASRWWLHRSLGALSHDLAAIGAPLETLVGPTESTLLGAIERHGARSVHWNRRYAPAERALDARLKDSLRARGLVAESHPGNVLVEPFDVATRLGEPFSVYTPFWNALRQRTITAPLAAPHAVAPPIQPSPQDGGHQSVPWMRKLERRWAIGEAAARQRLEAFLVEDLGDYPAGRDFPARDVTSRLSPHLAHGEISARQVWHAAQIAGQHRPELAGAVHKFLMELAWRDFNIHQLYHREDIASVPMQARYARMPWRHPADDLVAWQEGRTGFALIDAGMRELWETGFMHNRVRMLVASLLSKNLLLDWRLGEQWFWDTLVDADPASNPGNWQWVAGCGLDAAPYFRIFNPEVQATRFDPERTYVRRWAPPAVTPIIDLKASRERALAAFRAL